MTHETRLPSFNDFSPGIFNSDIRTCLAAIKAHSPNDQEIYKTWSKDFFDRVMNKRATTNIPATLRSTGLATTLPLRLTEFGEFILSQETAVEAARLFCQKLIESNNADKVIKAIANLNSRQERVTKDSLKVELQSLGVSSLATATTDHTTLRNWMVVAGYLRDEKSNFALNDELLGQDIGISSSVVDALEDLTAPQRIFLLCAKRRAIGSANQLPTSPIIKECIAKYPKLFDDDQIRKQILEPLEKGGWLVTSAVSAVGRGGKSGEIRLTSRTLDLSDKYFIPRGDDAVPAELRRHLNTPLSKIEADLDSNDKHRRGMGLELLALRMVIALDLEPTGFRARSVETAFAEVDLIAEGAHLLFSRWTIQCKNTQSVVALSAVAKEVGIAVYSRAHVIMMVTTSSFSREALAYAKEVSRATHLQFLFVTGKVVRAFLRDGVDPLLNFVFGNASQVMQDKRAQPTGADLPAEKGGQDSPEYPDEAAELA